MHKSHGKTSIIYPAIFVRFYRMETDSLLFPALIRRGLFLLIRLRFQSEAGKEKAHPKGEPNPSPPGGDPGLFCRSAGKWIPPPLWISHSAQKRPFQER